jgi:hypothetical protein
MNAVIVELAREYDVPLINFWKAARDLPQQGIQSDNAHLTTVGYNERNRLTLIMLDRLQRVLDLDLVSASGADDDD